MELLYPPFGMEVEPPFHCMRQGAAAVGITPGVQSGMLGIL